MRVLIIDDNPLDIEMVSRMLKKRRGADVESVHTAEEGLRRLQVEMFDVVLLDYCLPGKNGLDFLGELQVHEISTPVLLVTARGDDNIQEIARQAGAVDYISKDESLTPALYRAVEAAAERGRAVRAEKERARAEELRHDAELMISALRQRLEHLEGLIGTAGSNSVRPLIETLTEEEYDSQLRRLTDGYCGALKLWLGNSVEAHEARELLSGLVAEFFRFGFNGEHLLSLHTASLHALRDEGWELHGARGAGCSPRMFLLEASIALMEAYRRAAFVHPECSSGE